MTNDSIQIHHFHAQYLVPNTGENTSAIQRRCDRIAVELLPHAWENQLVTAAPPEPTDEALYFIKDINLKLSLNITDADDRAIAQAWAQALHQGIQRAIRQGGSDIKVFRNRSEFVANFVEEVIRGDAWSNWYYQEFESLRSRSLAQIVLTVLTQDGNIGGDALLSLVARGVLDSLLHSLSDSEVETLVARCLLPPSPRVVLSQSYPGWLRVLRSHLASPQWVPARTLARNVARIYLVLINQHPTLGPDVNLARFLQELLSWHQILAASGNLQSVLDQLRAEDVQALVRQPNAPFWLAPLVREVRGQELANVLQDLTTPGQQQSFLRGQFTPFGGIFLLIPSILELRLAEFLQICPYPEPEHHAKVGWMLFAISLQCLGLQHRTTALNNTALAMFAGLSALPTEDALTAYAAHLTTEQHSSFQQSFHAHLAAISRDAYTATLLRGQASYVPEHRHQLRWATDAPGEANTSWDDSLTEVSGTVLHLFAARLGAFAGSSPDYLRRNVLMSEAQVEQTSTAIKVAFLACPLQMVLRMSGFDSTTWPVAWWGDLPLTFEFE